MEIEAQKEMASQTEVKVMGTDELHKIEQDLPEAEEVVEATEKDIDKIRQKYHLPEPTRADPEQKEGYNARYLEIIEEIQRDPRAIEFAEFSAKFPAMVERIIAEIFQEGSHFEQLHPKHAVALRLLIVLYEELKRFDAEETLELEKAR